MPTIRSAETRAARHHYFRNVALSVLLLLVAAGPVYAQSESRTVQPGAPGEPTREVDGLAVSQLQSAHTKADVDFMQGMIHHHLQALEMTALVPDRSARADVQTLARRIESSQDSEIALMVRWLETRGEEVPPTHDDDHRHHAGDHQHHHDHHRALMPGMLTPAQMAELAGTSGEAFDRLFLEFMIFHHEGTRIMVDELFSSEGGGQEPAVFDFASHVDSDQRIEIARMRSMLSASTQPGTE
jgi:uncharacterized protein (DUF305 family)